MGAGHLDDAVVTPGQRLAGPGNALLVAAEEHASSVPERFDSAAA
jgi:hypothetical protein